MVECTNALKSKGSFINATDRPACQTNMEGKAGKRERNTFGHSESGRRPTTPIPLSLCHSLPHLVFGPLLYAAD